MKIYTRTGDDGTTSLFRGGRVPKHDLRVQAYGEIDELNSAIGVATAFLEDHDTKQRVIQIQSQLFLLGSDLATKQERSKSPKYPYKIQDEHVQALELYIDEIDDVLPPLTSFILPGGSKSSALFHLARTICRRAERTVSLLSQNEQINPEILPYLNRLSDLLFNLARYANYLSNQKDIVWNP